MIRSSLILALAICFLLLCGYGIHAGLARLWGPGLFGDYIVVMTILLWAEIIINTGVPTAVSKLISEDRERQGSILKSSLAIQLKIAAVLVILLVILAPVIGKIMHQKEIGLYLLIAAIDIPFMGFYALYHKALSGRHQFGRQAGVILTYAASRLLAILGIAALGYGITGALLGNIIGSAIGLIAGLLLFGSFRLGRGYESRRIIEIARPTAIYWVSFYLLIGLDLVCIRAMIPDPAVAGYYGAALTLARIPYFVFFALNLTLIPLIARALKLGSKERASAYIRQAVTLLAILLFIGIALVLSTSRELVALVYSASFLPAAPNLNILIFALGFLCFFMVMSSILIGAGYAKKATYMSLFLLPLALVLNLVFIPIWGPIGAASATLATALVGAVIAVRVTTRVLPIPVETARLIKAFLSAAILYLLSARWNVSGGLLLFKYLILLLAYFIVLLLTRALSIKDIQALLKKEDENPCN